MSTSVDTAHPSTRILRPMDDAPRIRLEDALAAALPWVEFLPDADRVTFAAETATTLRACNAAGRYTDLAILLEDWHATTLAWATPRQAAALAEPIPEPLNRPVVG
jgi:hypothetical protein